MSRLSVPMVLVMSLLLLHCGGGMEEASEMEAPMAWPEIAGFEMMAVPDDNPMTEAKVALGKQLYYDQRLSGDGNRSCYGCHLKEHGLTDGRAMALGAIRQATHPGGPDDVERGLLRHPVLGWAFRRAREAGTRRLGRRQHWELRVMTGLRQWMTFAPRSTRSPGMRNNSRPSSAAPQHRITPPMPLPRS